MIDRGIILTIRNAVAAERATGIDMSEAIAALNASQEDIENARKEDATMVSTRAAREAEIERYAKSNTLKRRAPQLPD